MAGRGGEPCLVRAGDEAAADGRTFVGVNLHHSTGGPCAELVALGAARAGGAREITTIVAVGNHGRGVMGPCGRDRQVLVDYYPGIRVLLPTGEGLRSVSAPDLLPWRCPGLSIRHTTPDDPDTT